MKLEAGIENLKNILVNDEKFYQIPDYQRPYSWDKDNLSDLIDDLVTSYLRDKSEDYFCGSLVLVHGENSDRYDIIDGQQRTTTFTILASVIKVLYFKELSKKAKGYIVEAIQDRYDEERRKLTLLTDSRYQNIFEQTVLQNIEFIETKHIENSFPDNRYLQNAHYLKEFLIKAISDNSIEIDDFVIWLYEHVVLTVITCPTQDSAIQIFNVLNDRGMPLSPIDILKSSLMNKIKDNREDRATFKSDWESIVSSLQEAELDVESMLTNYFYYKTATGLKERVDQELLKVFEKEKMSALKVVHELKEFSKLYIQLFELKDRELYTLRYLKHKVFWSSILSTALFVKYEEYQELKKLLVKYYYQNWIAGATANRIKQTSFNIIKIVKDGKDISAVIDEMEKNLKKYNTTKTFGEELVTGYVYSRQWAKPLLLLVEYSLTDSANPTFIPINGKLHLEHILPQNPIQEWRDIFTDEEMEDWTNSLANLTLLAGRKNEQAKNFDFSRKKEIYRNSDGQITSFQITQDILKYRKWGIKQLQDREEKLITKIYEELDF